MTMNEPLNYLVFNTAMGWMGILSSASGLRQLVLSRRSAQEVRQLLGDSIKDAGQTPRPFQDVMERLILYASGHKVNFPDKLDLSGGTSFQRAVWETTRLIPYGETRSYAWVAEQIEQPKAVRAVGQALGRNPLPIIIPCHRVLTSDGQLGGFTGGIKMKEKLLQLEGIDI
ncbi:methylated-DNA--[protein]-cysteine S-methyltransferase [Chloroflexota bacterium]